jgi:SAM-dependent methyltransferase
MTYTDAEAAALYDLLNAWGPSDEFYLDLVMAAGSVLDVGCGTGMMLLRAREAGHTGRLYGIDPDVASLDRARSKDSQASVEWVQGRAADLRPDGEFELAVMMSHAFQCFVGDDELRASLSAIRTALVPDGRFAFETRHPAARAWEGWNPANATELVDASGRAIRVVHEVESVVADVVTFSETTTDPAGTVLRRDHASLRFLSEADLDGFLAAAGFTVEARYGDWYRAPVGSGSREIVTIARRTG